MTTAQLKENLIRKISNTNDDNVLQDLNRLLDFETDSTAYILSEEQQKAVAEARQDIANGNVIDNDDVNDFFDQWLKK